MSRWRLLKLARSISASLVLLGTVLGASSSVSSASGCGADTDLRHYGVEQGLSQSSVYAVLQDHRGFIWIATQDGLNRFDGREFRVFRPDPQNPDSLGWGHLSSLAEDDAGRLWIGTLGGGLEVFDRASETFSRWQANPTDPRALASDRIGPLAVGRDGAIWVGTDGGGLHRFDAATEVFERLPGAGHSGDATQPADGVLPSDFVTALHLGRGGRLWVGTESGLALVEDGEVGRSGTVRQTWGEPTLRNPKVTALYEDRQGGLWVGTFDGWLHHFPPALSLGSDDRSPVTSNGRLASPRAYHLPSEHRPGGIGQAIVGVFEDAGGRLWIPTTRGGLFVRQAGGDGFGEYRPPSGGDLRLAENLFFTGRLDIAEDLWLGTLAGGVLHLDLDPKPFVCAQADPDDPTSLVTASVTAIHVAPSPPTASDLERSGALWVGTEGGGLHLRPPGASGFQHYRHDPGNPHSLADDTVWSILQDRGGDLWIGTRSGGLDRLPAAAVERGIFEHVGSELLNGIGVRALYEDRAETLWIGTIGLGLHQRRSGGAVEAVELVGPDGKPAATSVTAILESAPSAELGSRATLWIGALDEGLVRWDRGPGTVRSYRPDREAPSSLPHPRVRALYEDPAGHLWIATQGGGLARLDPVAETFEVFRSNRGLPNDVVYGILPDAFGRLWLPTNRGLARFDPGRGQFRVFDAQDGVPSNEHNAGAFARGPDGQLYFGGVGGLYAFHPQRLHANPYPPPVVITGLRLAGQAVTVGEEVGGRVILERAISEVDRLELGPSERVVSFELAALSFTQPEKNRFAYRMEGFDDAWIKAGTRRFATYTNLPAGTHIFRARAANHDDVWNDAGLALQVTVRPPFWRTWWFLGSLALGLVAAAVTFHQRRTRWALERATALQDLNNALEGEIAERGRLAKERERLIGRLERKSAESERFSYAVSHDLKNQLLTIGVYLGKVKRDARHQEIDSLEIDLERIREASRTMEGLLDGLLEVNRRGLRAVVGEDIVLNEVASEAIDVLRRRGLLDAVEIEVAADLGEVYGDRAWVREIYLHLIGNAIKFMGEQAAPRIEIGVHRGTRPRQLFVRDNGRGIDPRHHERIFRLFDQLDPGLPGTGIGLTIVRRTLEELGGQVWVESAGEGEGSTFFFTLPGASTDLVPTVGSTRRRRDP